jgi:hypothetical protein
MMATGGSRMQAAGLAVTTAVAAGSAGALVSINPALGILIPVAAIAAAATRLAPAAWIVAAFLSAMMSRVFVAAGAPGLLAYADLALVWCGYALSLARPASSHRRLLTRLDVGISVIFAVSVLSAAAAGTPWISAVLYASILGTPFAAVAILLRSPPSYARRIPLILGLIVLVEIPAVAFQATAYGLGDRVQGTLIDAGAAAHVVSAVVLVGSLFLLVTQSRAPVLWRVVVATSAIVVPIIGDAKQVFLAVPCILLALGWRGARIVAPVVLVPVLLFSAVPSVAKYGPARLGDAVAGNSGKEPVLAEMTDRAHHNLPTLLLGSGPATTVSRLALLASEDTSAGQTPVQALGLAPSDLTEKLLAKSKAVSGGGSSFDSPISSALGAVGDIGLVGFGAVVWLLVCLWRELRRGASVVGKFASGLLLFYLALGAVFDWWEEAPFTLVVGLIVAYALSAETRTDAEVPKPPAGRAHRAGDVNSFARR